MEHRTRVERIMVTGEQVNGPRDRAQGLKGAQDRPTVDLIRLEHVAADNNELASLLDNNSADSSDGIEPCLCEPRLRFLTQEVARHAQLPVAGVDESDHCALVRSR